MIARSLRNSFTGDVPHRRHQSVGEQWLFHQPRTGIGDTPAELCERITGNDDRWRRIASRAQGREQCEAVDAREPVIEDYAGMLRRLVHLEQCLGAFECGHREALDLERKGDRRPQGGVIVDKEDYGICHRYMPGGGQIGAIPAHLDPHARGERAI
jgi:hypothetical protein